MRASRIQPIRMKSVRKYGYVQPEDNLRTGDEIVPVISEYWFLPFTEYPYESWLVFL